jgi:uncharacterized protein YndB with AHSA1/START domain
MTRNNNATEVVVNRVINAPVATVWKAWTDPKAVMEWWGPADYTAPTARIDLREGGTYLFCMHAPDYQGGEDSYTVGEYKEINPMKKLVFTQSLANADGEKLSKDQLPPDFPEEVLTTVTFTDVNGMTELNITERGWMPSKMSVFAYAGMHESLDKMTKVLK